jgi:shikimate kinase
MAVILTGFMGTGKTTVGQQLAQRLGKQFIDTDQQIEQLEGRSIADIFANDGEAAFRAIERRVVAAAVKQDAVVATGGGAIVDRTNLEHMRTAGPIICLTATIDEILRRTATDTSRPLLGTVERQQRIEELLRTRAAAYAQADLVVDSSRRSIDSILDDILEFLQRSPHGFQRDNR